MRILLACNATADCVKRARMNTTLLFLSVYYKSGDLIIKTNMVVPEEHFPLG